MNETARALLDAHVQHELDGFRGDALERRVEEEVAALFAWLDEVRFADVSSPAQVMGVIERCVVDFQISGGIAEIAGQSANRVFSSAHNAESRLEDIIPPAFFEDISDKVASLEDARRHVLEAVGGSEIARTVIARVLERGVLDLLFHPSQPERRRRLLDRLGQGLARRVVPGIERLVASALQRTLEREAGALSTYGKDVLLDLVDERLIRSAADDAWSTLAPMRLDALFGHISDYDLEDFVVIGYEFWLKFRKTPYFRAVTAEVVELVFEKYGEDSVRSVIEDMGVDETMARREVIALLRPILRTALETGFLEARIRAHLEDFYGSAAVERILAAR